MRTIIYQALVNRKSGIRERYHRVHDGAEGILRIASWCYLLWLNLCYYIFFCRFLGKSRMPVYEEKRIPYVESESALACKRVENDLFEARKHTGHHREPMHGESLKERYIDYLAHYHIISFDLFDTLVFRPFSAPSDLFFLIGEKLDFLDFKRIREEMEAKARREKYERSGNYEVTLSDIWRRMERETGICAEEGERLEKETEAALCYANPFMLEVFSALRKMGKKIIVISDMYLSEECLKELLARCGYEGIFRIYVSNAYEKSKWSGSLFEAVLKDLNQEFGENIQPIHVGDNPHSDGNMAKKHGFAALHYPNADAAAWSCRAQDMSPVVGGAYRGVMNHHLCTGLRAYSMEYEYGYGYGGLFVVGYCAFIHDYVKKNQIGRLLFLSRDGDILKQVYDLLYPGEDTLYVYWSRAAALKLTADDNRYDFFRRYLYHKVGQKKQTAQILGEMELEGLASELPMNPHDILTDSNAGELKSFLLAHWEAVQNEYRAQFQAAGRYYARALSGCKKAAAVDIGWAGSGAMALILLLKRWQIPCELTGILAGTNSANNAEPDMSEAQLQSGKLVSYLFSQSHNRDVLKKHDPASGDNVYWELLLSSPTRQFLGFYPSIETAEGVMEPEGQKHVSHAVWKERLGISLRFGAMPVNSDGCRQIQRGIMDFAREYQKRFADYPYMFSISGRDACAPMLAAAGHNRKYLKAIAARFTMDVSVSSGGDTICRNI